MNVTVASLSESNELTQSDGDSGGLLPSIHPGEERREEFLRSLRITLFRLAKSIDASQT